MFENDNLKIKITNENFYDFDKDLIEMQKLDK